MKINRMALIVLVLLLGSFLQAAVLTGTVFDENQNTPIGGAEIVLMSNNGQAFSTFSGEVGQYTFEDVPFGMYMLMAQADGYQPFMHQGLHIDQPQVTFDIPMQPMGGGDLMLSGAVYNAVSGEPVPGVSIQLVGNPAVPPYETVSGEAGQYQIDGIIPGPYMLIAITDDMDYQPFQMPLEIFEDMTFDIALEPMNQGDHSLMGQVIDASTGQPVFGVMVMIQAIGSNGEIVFEGVSPVGDAGHYQFQNIPGPFTYNVIAEAPGYQPYQGSVDVDGETWFDISMQPEGGDFLHIAGQVTDAATGQPIPVVTVQVFGNNGQMHFDVTGDNGQYLVSGLLPGTYLLHAHREAGGYEPYDEMIEITENTYYSFAMNPTGQDEHSLAGFVHQAGQEIPVAGASIVAETVINGMVVTVETASQNNGHYSFGEIPPGNWFVHAEAEGFEPFDIDVIVDGETWLNIPLNPIGGNDEYTLHGIVFSTQSDTPVGGALVILQSPNGFFLETWTGENGYYSFDNIPGGVYQLHAGAEGYHPFETTLQIWQNMQFMIPLEPMGGGDSSLYGAVIDGATGQTIPGAHVVIHSGNNPGDAITLETWTGEDGMYVFPNIPGERSYDVMAQAPGYQAFSGETWVDGPTGFDVTMFGGGDGFILAGTVTDHVTGELIGGVLVHLQGGGMAHTYITGNDGAYYFENLNPGEYHLEAHTNNPYYLPFDADLAIDHNIDFDIELIPAGMFEGQLSGTIHSGDAPLGGAEVALFPANDASNWIFETQSGNDGFYQIDNIPPGVYILVVHAPGHPIYVHDGDPDNPAPLVFEAGTVLAIDVWLELPPVHEVTGIVMNQDTGQPVAGAVVTAWPVDPWMNIPYGDGNPAVTGNSGEYTLVLPEGEYTVWAEYYTSNIPWVQFWDHKDLYYEADILPVFDDVADVDFDFGATGTEDASISGTITVNGMPPAMNALVAVVSADGNWDGATQTGEGGTYTIDNLPAGDYYVMAYVPGAVPTFFPGVIEFDQAELVTAEGDVFGIDFDMSVSSGGGAYSLSGFVSDGAGRTPVANATVAIVNSWGQVVSYAQSNAQGFYQATGLPQGQYQAVATKLFYHSDQQDVQVTTGGVADFVIQPCNPTGTEDETELPAPAALTLDNYPNPFNPETTLRFNLNQSGHTRLEIYNILGQKVRTLVDENRESGMHEVVWKGKDDNGDAVSSGIFFCKLVQGGQSSTRKMILMK